MGRRIATSIVVLTGVTLLAATTWAQGSGEQNEAGAQSAASEKAASPSSGQPAAAAPAGASAADQAASADQIVRLKGLEQRVNELKERIFRSKRRLSLLKETVLHGVIAGSRAIITSSNEMGGTFRLIKLIYAIDGQQIYAKSADDGSLDDKRKFEVFNGSIVPGNHTISVTMVFQGHGYGVFTYLKGYRFTVRASHTFTAAEGRQNQITVRAYEKGNATTALRDRPAVKFDSKLFHVTARKGAEK